MIPFNFQPVETVFVNGNGDEYTIPAGKYALVNYSVANGGTFYARNSTAQAWQKVAASYKGGDYSDSYGVTAFTGSPLKYLNSTKQLGTYSGGGDTGGAFTFSTQTHYTKNRYPGTQESGQIWLTAGAIVQVDSSDISSVFSGHCLLTIQLFNNQS
tara:strand:+ start:54 stop:521 length:468 start_codon:yes stop_codon:yes gene_type:complete